MSSMLCNYLELVAAGEMTLGLGPPGAEARAKEEFRARPLGTQHRSLQGPRRSPGKKESGIPDRKLGSQAGGGKGETQAMLCSPLLELTSVFRGWPGRQARLGTWLAGSLQEGLGPRPWLR